MKYYKQGDECTFEPGQEEYELLEALADKLMELSPNGFKYWVDDVYLDYGSKWMWTTIISEDTISPYFQSTYQALSPAEWLALMNGEDITEIAKHVLSDKYCPDNIKSAKIIRKGTYIKTDVNSYSYVGDGFADDSITLAHFTGDNGYGELVKDLSTCYVTSQSFLGDYDFYREYPMSEIDTAIKDFNKEVKRFGGTSILTRRFVEQVLQEYGMSLSDYVSSSTNIASSKTVVVDPVTIPNIRKAMRNISRDDYGTTLLIPGFGQIQKIGKRYAVGPLPENDDSDVLTDYSAWSYDVSEGQVLDWIKSELNSVNSATNTCNIASKPVFGDDDFEEDDFSETYTVYGYYGSNFYGLSDSEDFDNLSQAEDYVWELLQNGAYVELVGPDSTRRFSPDKLDESLKENGEVYDITDAEINR